MKTSLQKVYSKNESKKHNKKLDKRGKGDTIRPYLCVGINTWPHKKAINKTLAKNFDRSVTNPDNYYK
jgi:hypothetical protein